MYKLLCTIVALILLPAAGYAQANQWLFRTGAGGNDMGVMCKVAPNGNILFAGNYIGTIDLDPSTATYNISSYNNTTDVFVACYSATHTFLWGFSLGKEDLDGINTLTIDANNNVYIGGYFRGNSVDFDPSSGTAILTCAGNTNGATDWGGDGFIAKYSATGTYQWAHSYGTQWGRETVDAIAVDNSGNVIVSGAVRDVADVDVGSGTWMLSPAVSGTVFLAKYNSSMQIQWAFLIGKPGTAMASVDNSIRAVKTDGTGNVYITGFVQNDLALDFDPGIGVAHFTVSGLHDAYVAKYTPAGAYSYAFLIGNTGIDDFMDIALDGSSNIYVTGISDATTVDFDPSSSVANASAQGGGLNIMLASYTGTGVYRWGKLLGNSGNDFGRRVHTAGNFLYTTGYFSSSVNFNQGGTPAANMTSAGNTDIFCTRHLLNGTFDCAFRVGGTGDELGMGVVTDALGDVYLAGSFSGTNVDFDPSPGNALATSAGGGDAFVAKYKWNNNSASYLVADTVCTGQQAYMTYVETGGQASATIVYTDGTTNYTRTVQNGVPFALTPNPTATTNYWLIDPVACALLSTVPPVVVQVKPSPTANAGNDTAVCNTPAVRLSGSGAGSYAWTSAQTITNPTVSNPTVSGMVTGTYRLIVTNNVGCSDTDQVTVTSHPVPTANAGPDVAGCAGKQVWLTGTGGGTYLWYSTLPIATPNSPGTGIAAQNGTVYLVVTNSAGCSDTDDANITVMPEINAHAGNDTSVCPGVEIELLGTVDAANTSSKWFSAITIPNPTAQNIKVKLTATTEFLFVATDTAGCADTAKVKVSVIPPPSFSIWPQHKDLCKGDNVLISASGGGTYAWSSGNFTSANASISVSPDTNTVYRVIVKSVQCDYADTLEAAITSRPLPDVKAVKSNNLGCFSGSAELSADGAVTYTWLPEYELHYTGSAGASVTVAPKTTTTYRVTGKTAYGCKNTADVTVEVGNGNDIPMVMPSAFSPNNDGKNDCYRIKMNEQPSSYFIQINNRWGQAVFLSKDITECWDGKFLNLPADFGTYYYYLKTKVGTCDIFKKGDITLIR